ncbi:MAG: histidine--tRNA ligase [Clostridia bacterium]|jgi:histidyl-tRNA synthetase|nr:histidine--tRNA ligase [Clostridia bacterium]MBQ6865229.1 histidine--tRNA ligase [Clostridia bacterium]MBQ6892556.1 histidine--tRNA ligase [Clostridia bacterium]MBQ7754892.1 histidine--tRNA ligase [Clostridia bacterium]MBQ9323859.1 histidine--tRNA ligase [Clostridia bacterium]
MAYQAPKGTRDVTPGESYRWQYVEELIRRTTARYGFKEIRTPVIEHTELFLRSVGDTTDVVQKEMYTFNDKGGRSITLKPEGTAGTVRMFVEHGLFAEAMPLKVYYLNCPVFRYERPQAGRLREHHQFGVECFGAPEPSADAEVISMAWDIFTAMGARDLTVKLNSIGCPKCRDRYQAALKAYLSEHREELCEDCQVRLEKNPLRVLDCKVDDCKKINAGAPHTLDYVCDECRAHMDRLRGYLDAVNIPYEMDPMLVRGLDYYTRTVFEIVSGAAGAQGTLCGGGRYDGLVKQIGGPEVAAVGFGLGIERLLLYLDQLGVQIPKPEPVDVLIFGMGDAERQKAFELVNGLRKLGFSADTDHVGRSVKANFKYAGKTEAKHVLVIGENELKTGKGNIKEMATGEQTEVSLTANDIAETIGGEQHE